jgi:RND family efflux transporter MFP subunit
MSEQKKLLDELRIDRNAAPQPASRVAPLLAAGVLVVVVGAGAYWLGKGAAAPVPTPAPGNPATAAVATAPAGTAEVGSVTAAAAGTDAAVLSASGYITARRMATVASRITGQITEVVVEEGMKVAAGDVLARLDDNLARVDFDLAEARVRAAQASVASSRAVLSEAERVLKRIESLEKTDFSSEAALTEARAAVERFTAALANVRAEAEVAGFQVAAAREQLDLHVIRAPFAGVVTEKTAQPGEVVSPMSAGGGFTRTGICTIVDMASLEIEVDVNEAYIGRVSAGQPVTATLDAYPDWKIAARVIAIIPSANREKATVRVRIGLEQTDARILPDMGVKVAFMKS